ncbi:MAG: [ribosomal protein S18]-alanine N-acetyltransferase [Pseudonocardiales bacterium]|nr:[ribosomal protein S18]-alanine N-acetyltransferase [Pseudonocardiales bacterium]
MSGVSAATRTAATVQLVAMRWWHIPAVGRLELELFGDEAWSPELFWSELASSAAYYLVALPAGDRTADPVGYAGLSTTGADSYIQTIGVTTSTQRSGIGRLLMLRLLAEAERRGAEICWLEVRTDNAAAQHLYRTLGFIDRGVRRGYYQPSGADALMMAVPLPLPEHLRASAT